jgi:hypothetical protein
MTFLNDGCKLLTLGIAGAISLHPSATAVEPIWDAKGNYQPPDQFPAYSGWKVVDSDPSGLNCRIANQYRAIRFESEQSASPLIANNKHTIGDWPVLVKVPRNTVLTAPLIDLRGGKLPILVRDRNGSPWIPLKTYRGQCLVRANSRYIQPIPTTGQPQPKG